MYAGDVGEYAGGAGSDRKSSGKAAKPTSEELVDDVSDDVPRSIVDDVSDDVSLSLVDDVSDDVTLSSPDVRSCTGSMCVWKAATNKLKTAPLSS